MVYSTCTFAPEEDEGSIARFLEAHEDMHLVNAEHFTGMEPGRPEWYAAEQDESGGRLPEAEIEKCQPRENEIPDTLRRAIRLWPHKLHGEGHFVAVLEKDGYGEEQAGFCKNGEEKGVPSKSVREYIPFLQEFIKEIPAGIFLTFGDQLYLLPPGSPSLKGMKVLRPGLHLGTIRKNRMEPAHALALASGPEDALRATNLTEQEAVSYIAGETFSREGEKGWYLITVNGYSLGWGKLAGGIMKNHYPKGLRRTDLAAEF